MLRELVNPWLANFTYLALGKWFNPKQKKLMNNFILFEFYDMKPLCKQILRDIKEDLRNEIITENK